MIYKVTVGFIFLFHHQFTYICASIVFIVTPCNNGKLFLYFASAKMTLCHLIKCHVDVVSTSTDAQQKKVETATQCHKRHFIVPSFLFQYQRTKSTIQCPLKRVTSSDCRSYGLHLRSYRRSIISERRVGVSKV